MINHPRRSHAAKSKLATRAASTHDHDYSALLAGVRASFADLTAGHKTLFQTDADGLNDLYLKSLPSELKVHDCCACRRFIGTYGNLVTINDAGETAPVMWRAAGVPEFYHAAFTALSTRVKKARVTSVFLSGLPTWGQPITGQWSHIHVMPPASFVYRDRALTANQAMAAARENFRTVATALTAFTSPMLDEAIRLLSADALDRSEKFIGPVKWLRALQDRPKGRLGENILWRAISLAPDGYCHPKASVVGPLLDDIAAGLPFAEIKARFDAKLGPLIYQRPQVAPSAGNIKAAEELVAKLGIAPSLERRFARLDELWTIWKPADERPAAPADSVFGHIKPKGSEGIRPVDMPAVTMTWDKFTRTVLPTAERMEIHVPTQGRFIALTTAVHLDAPPIFKWDRDDERNPVSMYVYHHGSAAVQWKLRAGTWTQVNALAPLPMLWGSKPMPFLGDGVVAIIDGAVDTRDNSGNALFPECLKEELHGARATIEAFSRTAKINGREEASACGYSIGKNAADCFLRAFDGKAWTSYRIDRWD